MAVTTVEQALAQMADELKGPRMAGLARQALAKGGDLQVLLTVRPARQGAVVSMEARDCIVKKFGTFIRLR
ncbi:hypothetical protein HOP60_09950 [Halomonas daqingensis]|uniref:Uncharacterized protein n=1 Tax=Billgrantia desiderata TaxID=52021 RepID=A0ABS9B4D9_9GAMM|nr:hypothetical protein [Halomonas desiderata]MCE8042476.1 hypothetical protein [Halomonas desiderata]MCE8047051.1 hypothetical protein [Halomonas desiderata]